MLKNQADKNSVYDLIIIGGGSAAFSAAIQASEFEKKALMLGVSHPKH